jgi:hypothetical protein
MWKCYADGRVTRELLEESESRIALADGIVALEASFGADVFCESRERTLKSLRALLTREEYEQSQQRYTAALENARQLREALARQMWQSSQHANPDGGRAKRFSYVVKLRSPRPLSFTSGPGVTAAASDESFWKRVGYHDSTGMPVGRSGDRPCDQHHQN